MKNIEIPAVKEAPYFPIVHFDHDKGVCEISGESYMEDCYKFYIPLIEWLTEYCAENKYLIFNFRLFYFNTQSSRMLLKIFETLTEFKAKGGEPTINWYYMKTDPDMIDEIQDFQHETGLEINLLPIGD